jgi:long-chain acyl-CoA synthetase
MMTLTRAVTLLISLVLMGSCHAMDLAGVTVEPRTRVEGHELVLNGVGIRSRFMIKIYVAALYVVEPSNKAAGILGQPGSKRMMLTLLRDVSADTLLDGMRAGLKKNLTANELTAIDPQNEQLAAIFRAVGEGKKGDRIVLDWVPTQGTTIRINGVTRGQPISGETFYGSILKIWLGDHPAQEDLRDDLLGRQ